MVLLGQLIACLNTSTTISTSAQRKESEREKSYTSFTHQGKPVCARMFRFLHGIGEKRLKNLTKSLKENGLSPRVHGNAKRKPRHALSFSSIECVVRFLFWRTLVPSIVVMKPRSDLCCQCQQNSATTVRTANSPECEKSAAISDALEHLRIIKKERAHYKATCKECKTSIQGHFITDESFTPPPSSSRTYAMQLEGHQSALLF